MLVMVVFNDSNNTTDTVFTPKVDNNRSRYDWMSVFIFETANIILVE